MMPKMTVPVGSNQGPLNQRELRLSFLPPREKAKACDAERALA